MRCFVGEKEFKGGYQIVRWPADQHALDATQPTSQCVFMCAFSFDQFLLASKRNNNDDVSVDNAERLQ